MSSAKTKPEVFIVESLDWDDEENNRLEGQLISEMLRMIGKNPIYYYIRTEEELEEVIDKFEDSKYRYLHFSSHADKNGIKLTLGYVSYADFAKIVGPTLEGKRFFASGCEMSNETLAKSLIAKFNCFSVIGPCEKIRLGASASFWVFFYTLLFEFKHDAMKLEQLRKYVNVLSALIGVEFSYFNRAPKSRQRYTKVKHKLTHVLKKTKITQS